MKAKFDKYIKILTIAAAIIFLFFGANNQMIEETELAVGVGEDIEKGTEGAVEYSVPINVYTFADNSVGGRVIKGEGLTFGKTRESRQLKSSKKFTLGFEQVNVVSKENAEYGIKNVVDILFANPNVNDAGTSIVFDGKAEDALRHNSKQFTTASEELASLVKNSRNMNFFLRHYDIMDLYKLSANEGYTYITPYVGLEKDDFKVEGMALFKNLKMIGRLDMDDTKYLNIMRENNVTGMLSIIKSSKEYLDFYGKSKRKIDCSMENGKYNFSINISCTGNLISNEMYTDITNEKDIKKLAEEQLEREIEKKCKSVIDKLQNQYKIDAIQLGSCAVSKYGRHKGIDWDEVASNSKVDVKVNVEIDRIGRGDY